MKTRSIAVVVVLRMILLVVLIIATGLLLVACNDTHRLEAAGAVLPVVIKENCTDGKPYQDCDGTWGADPEVSFFPNERIGQRVPLLGRVGEISAYDWWEAEHRFDDKPEGLPADFIIITSISSDGGTPRLPTRCEFDNETKLYYIVADYSIKGGSLIGIIGNCGGIIDGVAVLTSCSIIGKSR